MKLSLSLLVSAAVLAAGAAGFAAARTLQEGEAMAAPQPTEQHRWLASHAGEWDAVVSGMGGDSKGTSKTEVGPGGLWVLTHFKGDMMGGPFEGREFMGYDPATKTFNAVWIDSWTTTPIISKGTYDPKTQVQTMEGMGTGPDGTPQPHKFVTEFKGEDTMVFKMMAGDTALMTITYTRKKK
jgi:hypothetical protein